MWERECLQDSWCLPNGVLGRLVKYFGSKSVTKCCGTEMRCKTNAKSGICYHTWVEAKGNGSVVTSHCTCMAGLSEVCNHVGAILYKCMQETLRSLKHRVLQCHARAACNKKLRSHLLSWPILTSIYHSWISANLVFQNPTKVKVVPSPHPKSDWLSHLKLIKISSCWHPHEVAALVNLCASG